MLFQFAVGWWIVADAAAAYPDQAQFPKACHTAGVISTLALIMWVLWELSAL